MIRVGLLGTGFACYHAELYNKIDGYELVWIYGRNKEKLRELKGKHNVKITNKIEDILEDESVDLIDVCLPTHMHEEWVIKALNYNKDVFCETPISYCVKETERMAKVSNETKKKVFVDLFYKFSTPHKRAVDLIKSNQLGDLKVFKSFNMTSRVWGDLSINKNISDFHIHNYDFLLEVMPDVKSLFSSAISLGEGKSSVITTMKFEDDEKMAIIESHSDLPDNSPFFIGFELICTTGIIKFSGEYGIKSKEEFVIYHDTGEKELLKLQMKDDYEEVLLHVLDCLKNKRKSKVLDLSDSIKSLELINIVKESINTNKVINI